MQSSARASHPRFTEPAFRRRLRRRDPGAWADLYDAYGRRLEGVARRILPPRLDPEAAAQQSWVRALGKAGRLARSQDPYPWLCTICINVCISVLRRDKVWRRLRPGTLVPTATGVAAPQPALNGADRGETIRAHVAQLPRTLQQVVYLRFGSRFTVAESAEVLGTSAGAVRQRLSRAYRALRERVDEGDAWDA